MALLPAHRGDSPYATAAELLTQDDRPIMDVRVPGWRTASGEPVFVRMRALSLSDRQWINITAGTGEKRNERLFIVATLHRGIVDPPLNWEQAQLMSERNERIVDVICDSIWELSGLDQTAINNLVAELAGASLPDGHAAEPLADPSH
jgi:hypothetical protein